MAQAVKEAKSCEVYLVHPERVEAERQRLLRDEEYSALAATFGALADATRAKVVYALMEQELCTCDLAAIAGVSRPAVSQHLNVLRKLRLVKSRRSGKVVYHSIDDAHITMLVAVCLAHVRGE